MLSKIMLKKLETRMLSVKINKNSFLILLTMAVLISSVSRAGGLYYRTICQDPKDTIVSSPLCTKGNFACAPGMHITQVRAACESDAIQDLNWDSLKKVAWNKLFVSKTIAGVPWACSVGGVQSAVAGTFDLSTSITAQTTALTFACAGTRKKDATTQALGDPACQILVEYHCE
jgi:hypothetical protein